MSSRYWILDRNWKAFVIIGFSDFLFNIRSRDLFICAMRCIYLFFTMWCFDFLFTTRCSNLFFFAITLSIIVNIVAAITHILLLLFFLYLVRSALNANLLAFSLLNDAFKVPGSLIRQSCFDSH